jgi:hypothetical protein
MDSHLLTKKSNEHDDNIREILKKNPNAAVVNPDLLNKTLLGKNKIKKESIEKES